MARHVYMDWYAVEQQQARHLSARIKAEVPAQWGRSIDAMAIRPASDPVWQRYSGWLDRLQKFRTDHREVITWNMPDVEVCQRAETVANEIGELLSLWPTPLSMPEQAQLVRQVCKALGVEPPAGDTAASLVERGKSLFWWRQVLRKKVARLLEHGFIKQGLVNFRDGAYVSNEAVERRLLQLKRNEALLAKCLVRNEAGQVYTLKELAAVSVANPEVRRGELMARIRGCEEFADAAGHVGTFATLTCPSRFHSALFPAKGSRQPPRRNPKYEGASPRDAQLWLRTMWARSRAEFQREGLQVYGFRVAEPHHDGCPHWHALLWTDSPQAMERVQFILRKHWLSEDGTQPGARKNRAHFKPMTQGGAAGYMVKYVAKNVVGGQLGEDGQHLDAPGGDQLDMFNVDSGAVTGAQRVEAWASLWRIRQFQAIGQPPVTVWREMRRVTKDQVEHARMTGEPVAWRTWGAVHRHGEEQASWSRYMHCMGGVCRKRTEWTLQVAKRCTEAVNQYGETVPKKVAVGVEMPSGRWLVSRRQLWKRVVEGRQNPESRASMARPWTGFNNCTARLTGELRRAFLGRGRHEIEDWTTPAVPIQPATGLGRAPSLSF